LLKKPVCLRVEAFRRPRRRVMSAIVVDASSGRALAAAAVLRAIVARNSGAPDADWIAFLEADLRPIFLRDAELEAAVSKIGWHEDGPGRGCFQGCPNLADLRSILPVFVCRAVALEDGRRDFERHVTRFINKAAPRTARQAAQDFATSGLWHAGEERQWRLHAFASLLLKSFAKVSRFRPALGNLFQASGTLSAQVTAASELLLCTPGLREAVDLWIFQGLGCQQLWAPERYVVCAIHRRRSVLGVDFGTLPPVLLRRILDFIFPETQPAQRDVTRAMPLHLHATQTEVALIFGHLIWNCPRALWEVWTPTALMVVETLLPRRMTSFGLGEVSIPEPSSSRVHQAALLLAVLCGRLLKEPLRGMVSRAAKLTNTLVTAVTDAGQLEGYVRHCVACAAESAATLSASEAVRIQAAWRGWHVRRSLPSRAPC